MVCIGCMLVPMMPPCVLSCSDIPKTTTITIVDTITSALFCCLQRLFSPHRHFTSFWLRGASYGRGPLLLSRFHSSKRQHLFGWKASWTCFQTRVFTPVSGAKFFSIYSTVAIAAYIVRCNMYASAAIFCPNLKRSRALFLRRCCFVCGD